MNQEQHSNIVSFIWNIANILVNNYNKGDYRKIIMPFMVLRRLDAVLEGKKDELKMALETADSLFPDKAANESQRGTIITSKLKLPYFNDSGLFLLDVSKNKDNMFKAFEKYINGYSQNVKDILEKFEIRRHAGDLANMNLLGKVLEKFLDNEINLSPNEKRVLTTKKTGKKTPDGKDEFEEKILPPLDNHAMGTAFEQLLRKFNEENNVTEAGEHFTPRDIVSLLADVAIFQTTLGGNISIYDGACGTGGILTKSKERMLELQNEINEISLYGQELQRETFATCKADILMSDSGKDADNIRYGSTINNDQFKGETFDLLISNPPFGTPYAKELNQNDWIKFEKKEDITDHRFSDGGDSFLPNIGDCQMLFLANNISKMKSGDAKSSSRIVEIHNGSSLFTGSAGSGESNLRKYILKKDLLEAIIAMPENMFYNTGIATFIWVLNNNKSAERKGKIQLINATEIKTPLRKNMGQKNCEFSPQDRAKIMDIYQKFEQNEQSKIFAPEDFGYWLLEINMPLKDENGKPVLDKKGNPKFDKKLKDTEQVPMTYPGGIEAFAQKEILPYKPEAIIDFDGAKEGYEINFTKYFYKAKTQDDPETLRQEFIALEQQAQEILKNIF